jgi:hypothetical protein
MSVSDEKFQQAAGLVWNMHGPQMRSREQFVEHLGKMYDGDRDVYDVLGYKDEIEAGDYRAKYRRQDVAKQIVELPAKDTWREPPEVSDSDSESEFESAVERLFTELNGWSVMSRADITAGIGEYGVVFLGFADNQPLDEPVNTDAVDGLEFVTPYAQDHVMSWELGRDQDLDPSDPRYNKPVEYELSFADVDADQKDRREDLQTVHWSRVIHVAEGKVESELKGTPRLEPVYNRLDDLEKVVGASAEAFWTGAAPKYQFNVDTDGQNVDPNALEDLDDEVQKLVHDMQNYVKTFNTDMEVISGEQVDPSGVANEIMKTISGTTGIPRRLLTGSERGELSSTQDRKNWFDRITSRQQRFGEPELLRPFINRLIEYEILPEPNGGEYEVIWPSLFELTQSETAEVWNKRADALKKISPKGNPDVTIPDAQERFAFMVEGDVPDFSESMSDNWASNEGWNPNIQPRGPDGRFLPEPDGELIDSLGEVLLGHEVSVMHYDDGEHLEGEVSALGDGYIEVDGTRVDRADFVSHKVFRRRDNPPSPSLDYLADSDQHVEDEVPADFPETDISAETVTDVREAAHERIDAHSAEMTADDQERLTDTVDTVVDAYQWSDLQANSDRFAKFMADTVDNVRVQNDLSYSRQLGDHGVRHISSNVENMNRVMDEIPQDVSARERFLAGIAQFYHDWGYAHPDKARSFDLADHPDVGVGMLEQSGKADEIEALFGEDALDDVKRYMRNHADSERINFSQRPAESSFIVADQLAMFADQKMPAVFRQVDEGFFKLKQIEEAYRDNNLAKVNELKDELRQNIRETAPDEIQGELLTAVNEIRDFTGDYTLGMWSGRLGDFDFDNGKLQVTIEPSAKAEHMQSLFDVGQPQFEAFADDVNADVFGDTITTRDMQLEIADELPHEEARDAIDDAETVMEVEDALNKVYDDADVRFNPRNVNLAEAQRAANGLVDVADRFGPEAVEGLFSINLYFDAMGRTGLDGMVEIHPDGLDVERLADTAATGWLSSRSLKHVVYHELGHRLTMRRMDSDRIGELVGMAPNRSDTDIMESVSGYAATELHEFIAEVFAAKMDDLTEVSDEANELYDELGGPS